jgi:hypothetical protein
MGSQTQAASGADRRKSDTNPNGLAWTTFLLVVTLLLVIGLYVSTLHLFKPGDDLGYNLGLVGGLMMLTLLVYPLRKRVAIFKGFGVLPTWFKWHMIFGIMGPMLVLFHSTYIIRSVNAGVALICMLLVSGSGIFGRFFYTKIHHGLYGRQTSMNEIVEEMSKTGSYNRAFLVFAPEIEHGLERFRVRAEAGQGGIWDFFSIGYQAGALSKSLTKNLHSVMYAQAHQKNWDSGHIKQDVDKLYQEYANHIRAYISSIRDVVQFRTYERLFSLWHIFHIPLVYMMVFSGVYHVLSVHMY